MVADAGLSPGLRGRHDQGRATSTLAVQRFLGETLALTAQVPNKQRSIVVAPQRMPTADQAQAMALALSSLQNDGRWAQGSDLSEAAKAKPDPGANRQVPSGRQYPGSLRKQELPTEAFQQMQGTKRRRQRLPGRSSPSDDRVVTPVRQRDGAREMSTSWRGGRQGRRELPRRGAQVPGGPHQAGQPDPEVGHHPLRPQRHDPGDRAEQPGPGRRRPGAAAEVAGAASASTSGEAQPIKVDGGHSQSVKFSTTAKANGRAYVDAQLYTKDGKPYGKPMIFQVNVTAITSTVLLVIAGGVLLVVLAGVRMYTTRKRTAARHTTKTARTTTEEPDRTPRDRSDERRRTADRRPGRVRTARGSPSTPE